MGGNNWCGILCEDCPSGNDCSYSDLVQEETRQYIRYELYVGDEPQNVGIFHGLYELDIHPGMLENTIERFDRLLIIPEGIEHTQSWFTETGEKEFQTDINRIIALYESHGLFKVRRITKGHLDNIVYEDKYQVLVEEKS